MPETEPPPEPEILCGRRGEAGLVTLDRPKALNALTLRMVRALRRSLDAWEADPAVTRVVIAGSGERAFCAGGDIRQLYELGRGGRVEEALGFWREEYELNIRIKRYPKPFVALIDGIVMGGGVGVSLHGSHRVAGDRYVFAMPEVGIGFFPDVGATYALPRLAGEVGTFLALTGERVRRADAVSLGLATHAVPSCALPALLDALAATAEEGGEPDLLRERATIDGCFSAQSVGETLGRLDRAGAFAGEAAATIRQKSPTSLAVALEQMRRGPTLSFEEAMRTEFRIVSRIADGHDFYEGVRAAIIDKDGAPRWRPASLEEIDPAAIQAYFAPLPRELATP